MREQRGKGKYLIACSKYFVRRAFASMVGAMVEVVGIAVAGFSLFGAVNIGHLVFGSGVLGTDATQKILSYCSIAIFVAVTAAIFISSAIKKGKEITQDE